MTPLAQVLATIAVAIIAASGTWLTLRVQRPKIVAERDSVVTATALSLITPLNERIDALQAHIQDNDERIASLEEELGMVRLWAQVLWRQVVELGGQPIEFAKIEEAWQNDSDV